MNVSIEEFSGPACRRLMADAAEFGFSIPFVHTWRSGYTAGRADEARDLLLRLGGRKFGPPHWDAEQAIGAMDDLARIRRLIDRVGEVCSWRELLVGP